MPPEPLIHWPEPIVQLIGFIAQFLAAGAIGFRFFALRNREIEADRLFYDDAAKRAAWLGLVGISISLAMMLWQLPGAAARKHVGATAYLGATPQSMLELVFFIVAAIGFLLAANSVGAGWYIAAIGVVVGALRAVFTGKWSSLVNPIHVLAAGLWIGTLLVLVVAGLSAVITHEPARERRGAIAADMVNGFSPLALSMGAVVVLFGVITAWRHLHHIDALWTTPYGIALIVKLVFVAIVFALGAWNWRRQRPTLGTEAAASAIRRSATAELTVAAIVLIITAVIVSLPSPKG
ncbi:MAG TPA: CopD family protein [Gemmatimonadaceae bacterium]|jgi:putative copper export protein